MFVVLFLFFVSTLQLLNVHVVPHSHCDPGFTKTYEEYFDSEVKAILDNTIAYLQTHNDTKYIWVETSFLFKWWEQASEASKNLFMSLVHDTRQIEIVMGGWVMNDQACTTYSANIHQMTLGHRWLMKNIGVKTRQGWAIDPFGQTSTIPSLYKMMGFDYYAFRRIPLEVKAELLTQNRLNFRWRGSKSLSSAESELFSRVLPTGYSFIFDWERSRWPHCTNETVAAYSDILKDWIIANFEGQMSTEHVLIPFGHDFAFQRPELMFSNITCIMDYMNGHREKFGMDLKFSTLSEYFDAVRTEVPLEKWPVFQSCDEENGDFFVYDDKPIAYWSGYFVTYPEMKLLARQAERVLRRCEMLYSIAKLEKLHTSSSNPGGRLLHGGNDIDERLVDLRREAALFGHHDTITGTSKKHVREVDMANLRKAIAGANELSGEILSLLTCPSWSEKKKQFLLPPISYGGDIVIEGPVHEGDGIPVILFNSLGWKSAGVASLLIKTDAEISVVRVGGISCITQNVAVEYKGEKYNRLSFTTGGELDNIGYAAYLVQILSTPKEEKLIPVNLGKNTGSQTMENSVYEIQFDEAGIMKSVKNKLSGIEIDLSFLMGEFNSESSGLIQNSGAYIFRTKDKEPHLFAAPEVTFVENKLTIEATYVFNDYLKCVVRLYKAETNSSFNEFVEFEFTTGVLDVDKEVVALWKSSVDNSKERRYLTTDENAYETTKRVGKQITIDEIPAGFWPIQYSSWISDVSKDVQLTFITEKTQSVSSMKHGEVAMMLHRRTSKDDGKGVGEPVDDQDVVTFKIRMLLDSKKNSVAKRHLHSYLLNYPFEAWAADRDLWNTRYPSDFRDRFSPLGAMDEKVNFLSLNRFTKVDADEEEFIVRFAHIFEKDELEGQQKGMSDSVVFDLKEIFGKYNITSATATSLSTFHDYKKDDDEFLTITLDPIQIATYKVEFE